MPILKPGQALPGKEVETPELYGVKPQTNSIMFQERLLKLWRPQDWVNIKNIDTEPLFWQYVSSDSEREEYSEGGNMRQIYRNEPEAWYILPGESEPVPGAAAYLALDVLYKTMAAKKAIATYKDPSDPRKMKDGSYAQQSFNFSDANIQEDTIKKAFLGIVSPNFGNAPQPAAPVASEPDSASRWPEPAPTDAAPTKAKANAGTTR